MLAYQNIKKNLLKFKFQIGLKKILWLKKLKTLCSGQFLVILGRRNRFNVLRKRVAKNNSKRV